MNFSLLMSKIPYSENVFIEKLMQYLSSNSIRCSQDKVQIGSSSGYSYSSGSYRGEVSPKYSNDSSSIFNILGNSSSSTNSSERHYAYTINPFVFRYSSSENSIWGVYKGRVKVHELKKYQLNENGITTEYHDYELMINYNFAAIKPVVVILIILGIWTFGITAILAGVYYIIGSFKGKEHSQIPESLIRQKCIELSRR